MKHILWKNWRNGIVGILALLMVLPVITLVGCGGEKKDGNTPVAEEKKAPPSYGKIKHVDIGASIDASMVKGGTEIFETKCSACHKLDERYVGPSLRGVTQRRTPEYIMNMILDTETMIENDDTVKCLLQTFLMKMPNQSVDEKDARNVLEYLREAAGKK
ncbi:MAG: cytochrome c [Candidatus Kapabacteria bacterium]|nr:cytochrome c [Candidatus Kapabacteria bacterium]